MVFFLFFKSEAIGSLYLDDGETYDYEKGYFVYRQFKFSAEKLTSTSLSLFDNDNNIYAQSINCFYIEQIIVLGFDLKPSKIIAYYTVDYDFELQFELKDFGIIIKDSNLLITKDWTIKFLK